MLTIKLTREDFIVGLAYREFQNIVRSDVLSVTNKHNLRYFLSSDAQRLYPKIVEMVEIQANLDAGIL